MEFPENFPGGFPREFREGGGGGFPGEFSRLPPNSFVGSSNMLDIPSKDLRLQLYSCVCIQLIISRWYSWYCARLSSENTLRSFGQLTM